MTFTINQLIGQLERSEKYGSREIHLGPDEYKDIVNELISISYLNRTNGLTEAQIEKLETITVYQKDYYEEI